MTFEEFFNKKRIDLQLMKDADPALYSEFKSHFESMGEKSFDHTKKFWFNKLRHLYHLAEPAKKVVTQMETQIASQAEPLSSPTMEQNVPAAQAEAGQEAKAPASPKPGFRPRSIPTAAVKKQDQPDEAEADVTSDKPASPVSKPGFKPRNIKPVSGELSEDAQKTTSRPGQDIPSGASQGNTANVPRPTYKPRFKAGNLAQSAGDAAEEKKEEIVDPASDSAAKPAYKPRFNLKTTKKDVQEENSEVKSPSADQPVTDEDNPPVIQPAIEAPESKTEEHSPGKGVAQNEEIKAAAPKPAYKPRFNVKTIAPKATEQPPASSSEQPADSVELPAESQKPAAETPEEPAKPAYKPRFNMKNVKPKE
jgi:hypothetical protein